MLEMQVVMLVCKPAVKNLRGFVLQHRCRKYEDAKVQSVSEQMDAALEADASNRASGSSAAKLAASLTVLPDTVNLCQHSVGFVGRCSFERCKHKNKNKHMQTHLADSIS